jgi:hypothetical protein
MADLTMTIPDEQVPRVAAAARQLLLDSYGEDASGFTDAQTVKRWTKKLWIEHVQIVEGNEARQDASDQVETDLDGIQ